MPFILLDFFESSVLHFLCVIWKAVFFPKEIGTTWAGVAALP